MEVRFAVAAHAILAVSSTMSVTALCQEYGISRDRYYEYRNRFLEEGLEGLIPRSRRPRRSPNATPVHMEELIVAMHKQLVKQGWDSGARSVRSWLYRGGHVDVPSARTVHKILTRRGLTVPSPNKRRRDSYRRFEALRPNGIWQLDGHETCLADGTKAVVIRFEDDHSRMSMASRAASGETSAETWACMVTAMHAHGKPAIVLCDNSSAFTARFLGNGGYNEFETRLRAIGVKMINSSPRHPQTCGKKEREWQTQEKWLKARPRATDLDQLQQLLDAYEFLYNEERPHQSLDEHQTPAERYRAREKAQPDPATLTDRTSIHRVKVSTRGRIELPHLRVSLGNAWIGAEIDYVIDHDHVILFAGTDLIGYAELNREEYLDQPATKRRYLPIKIER